MPAPKFKLTMMHKHRWVLYTNIDAAAGGNFLSLSIMEVL